MWKYIRKYLVFAIIAALFMIGEVMMDLVQPGLMSRIVDHGVPGIGNGGIGNLNLIWHLDIQMILLVLFGGFCGSMNNVFVHMSGQNIGNAMRKECFCNIMKFSFPQLDRFGTGSLVTRVTNDITQVENFCWQVPMLWKRCDNSRRRDGGDYIYGTASQRGFDTCDVSFAYPGSVQAVLEHIDLKIYLGETVAIMGFTGCGKTSLIHLIPRFYDVTFGTVLVNGVDVKEYKQKALRDKAAVVLQKSELSGETIGENISWGRPDAKADDIRTAVVTAQADDFILAFSDGYDTLVAERGMSLSGGQKQRISIARAVIKGAEILIFDDSTSALDLKTEANLYEDLQKSYPDSTKIIVAQRVASVRRADRIVVMDHGRIVESGDHDTLLSQKGKYYELYMTQDAGLSS